MDNKMTTPIHEKNPSRYVLHVSGCEVHTNSAQAVFELLQLLRAGGKIALSAEDPRLPACSLPGAKPQADGTLYCPEWRVTATAEAHASGFLICSICGRKLRPVGGRMSAAPLVPMHLSASRAYKDRGCEVPLGVLKRLRKGGCIEAGVEKAKEGGVASAPELAKVPDEKPAEVAKGEQIAEPEKEAGPRSPLQIVADGLERQARGEVSTVPELIEMAKVAKDGWNRVLVGNEFEVAASGEPEKTAVNDAAPVAAAEVPSAETQSVEPAAPPVEVAAAKPQSAPVEKRPVSVPVRVRKPVEPREPVVVRKPPPPASSAPRPVRDARLIDTAGSAPSPQASRFKQMRQDLGVPISTVAEHSSLMLRELVSIESGELSPRPGTEDAFWKSMRENLSKANAAWSTPHPAPSGEPVQQPSARPKVPRSDSRMF